MCGIVGIWGQGDSASLRLMMNTIVHRGPDDGFMISGEHFALGARRLSIVDLGGGRQPLANEDGSIWAAQNGELYNFPTLQPQLLAKGHALHTRCDTELLPHLYEDHGVEFPCHIQGMFAVAIWDDNRQRGVLARDRMGKKPLYYHHKDGVLYFASEIKALLAIPGFERHLNLEALQHYLSLKHVPCPLSIFEGIYQLPPAHRLIFTPNQPLRIEPYWALDYSPLETPISEEEAAQELTHLLQQGIERRLMSDVPIGFFLSGGIDSSLTTVLAAEAAPSQIKTFTLTYANEADTPGKQADQYWANWIAQKYQTDHCEEVISFRHFPDVIGNILQAFDEPFAGVISTYFLSEQVAKYVKVAMVGDGADELFGSYRSHRLAFPMANYPSNDPTLLHPFEHEGAYLESLYEPQDWAWRYKLLVMSDQEKLALYNPDLRPLMQQKTTAGLMESYFNGLSSADPLNRMLEAEFRSIFPDQVLAFADRLSMAHSLELRSPFLDTDLVEFVAKLPGKFKIQQGINKYLLKLAASKYFPKEMLNRPKEGFLMPITQWLVENLEDYVRATLSPTALAQHHLFDSAVVQNLVDEMYNGNSDYTHVNKVYNLLIFQEWYQQYLPTVIF